MVLITKDSKQFGKPHVLKLLTMRHTIYLCIIAVVSKGMQDMS